MKRHHGRKQEIISGDGLKLRAMYIPRKNAKGIIICMHGYHSEVDIEFVPEVRFYGISDMIFCCRGREAMDRAKADI